MDIFLGTLFLIVCILLIAVVLLQRGRGGGLGAAFGGGAGSSAFGTRTGDVFTWVTIALTAAFLLLAIGTVLAHQQDPGMVATPEFSPKPGSIEEPVSVTISSATGGAEIWYTLDGQDPVKGESMPYERDPVPVSPGTTLRARAYRAGWQESEVAVGVYSAPQADEEPELPVDDAPADDAADEPDDEDADSTSADQTDGEDEGQDESPAVEQPETSDDDDQSTESNDG